MGSPYVQSLIVRLADIPAHHHTQTLTHLLVGGVQTEPDNLLEYTSLQSLDQVNSTHLPNIHRHVVTNMTKIAQSLITYDQKDSIPLLAHILAQLDDESNPLQPQ
jgi:hypothetical protein